MSQTQLLETRTDVLTGVDLLERDQELATIGSVVEAAEQGRGDLAVIEGPAGAGKSELLEAAAQMGRAPALVLRAAGHSLEVDFPFGVVLQLFERCIATLSPEARQSVLGGAARWAAPLFALRADEVRPAGTDSVIHGLFWMVANLASSMGGKGGDAPVSSVVLIVDDAHWADRPSLRFLAYLAQRLEPLAVAVVVAVRPDGAGDNVDLLHVIGEHPAARRMHPAPLSQTAVTGLVRAKLAGPADPPFCLACIRATGGNPFLVRELLTELGHAGVASTADAAERVSRVAPDTVLRSVLARLGRLGPEASSLARAAAVLGEEATLLRTATLADLELGAAASAADALAGATILAPGDPLRYAHPLVRSAVLAEYSPLALGGAHLAAARLLNEEGAPAEVAAGHLMAAPVTGDAWVLDVLVDAAARAVRMGAPGPAVRLLGRALSEPQPASTRAGLLEALAGAEAAAGLPGAPEQLRRALDLVAVPAQRAEVGGHLAAVLLGLGRRREAGEAYVAAVRELDHPDHPLARELVDRATVATVMGGCLTGLLTLPGEGPAEGGISALSAVGPGALAAFAGRLALTGEPAPACRSAALQALADGTLIASAPLDGALSLSWPIIALLHADDLPGSIDVLDRALTVADRHGSVMALATLRYLRAWPDYLAGRIADAVSGAEAALDASRQGWRLYVGAASAVLAHARLEQGDIAGAAEALDHVGGSMDDSGGAHPAVVLNARACLRLAQRDRSGALDDFLAAGRLLSEVGPGARPIPWRPDAALAALAAGDRSRARLLAAEEMVVARRSGTDRHLGMALRIEGLVVGGDRGVALLGQAVETLEKSGSALEHVRALVDWGAALRRGRQRADARRALEAGHDLARDFGAWALVGQAERELRSLRVKPRRTMEPGPGALTVGERRVTTMAAGGASNREIADALFVTTKAVEWHLANAYRKLAIRSRGELAGVLAD